MALDWTTLPLDVLSVIALKLETIEDFLSFARVCCCWNRVFSLIKSEWRGIQVPWLLLAEKTKKNPYFERKIFNLRNNTSYRWNLQETFGKRCWGTPYGWVAMVDRSFDVQLFNPITKAQIHFPSLKTFPNLRLFDQKRYNRRKSKHYYLSLRCVNLLVLKVTLSDHDEFVIVNNLWHFARHGDQSWTPIEMPRKEIADIVSMDNNIFALYSDGAIGYWNVKEFQNLDVVKPMDYLPPGKPEIFDPILFIIGRIYLVPMGSNLLAVLRYKEEVGDGNDYNDIVYRTTRFEVYRLDYTDKSWREIKDLGNAALFVGVNSSMCVSTSNNCLQTNSIYFTDDEYVLWDLPKKFGGHDMGVFDIKSGQIQQFYKGNDTRSIFCQPTFFIPSYY